MKKMVNYCLEKKESAYLLNCGKKCLAFLMKLMKP